MDEQNNNPIQGNDNNDPIKRSGESNQGQMPNQNYGNGNAQYNNYNQNLNQAPKKKSKAPLIIGIICAVLLVGCLVIGGIIFACVGIFNNTKKSIVNELNNINSNSYSNLLNNTNSIRNSLSNNTNTSLVNDLKNIVKGNNTVANNTVVNNTVANNTVVNKPANMDVKTSTQGNPIKKGEWGAASKYDAKTKDYSDAYVKVTNFVRGEDAVKLVKEYTDSSSYYKYTDPKEGMEYLVVEYEVDFSNFEIPSYGISLDLSPSVKGTKEGSSAITYNGINYYTTATSMNKDYAKTSTAKGKFAVQVPKGCTDYVVSFGAYGKTITYVKGE